METITKTYAILTSEDIYDYKLIIVKDSDKTTSSLYASNGNDWSDHIKGKLLLSLIDDGNGAIFSPKISTKQLEYNILEYMRILLNINDKNLVEEDGIGEMKYKLLDISEAINL